MNVVYYIYGTNMEMSIKNTLHFRLTLYSTIWIFRIGMMRFIVTLSYYDYSCLRLILFWKNISFSLLISLNVGV